MRRFICYPMTMLIFGQVISHSDTSVAAEFVNLDFESANLPVVPPDQSGGFVSIADALPGWDGYFGAIAKSQVLHNDQTLGSAAIAVWGPNYFFPSIEGKYNVWLFPGPDISVIPIIDSVDVSISQIGLVPVEAKSLQFKASISSFPSQSERFMISLGMEKVPVTPLFTSEFYTLYAGDVSSYAGQELELRFTLFDLPEVNRMTLDSIVFSPQVVPEPTTWALLGLGGLMAAWFGRRAHGKSVGRHNNKGWQEVLTARK